MELNESSVIKNYIDMSIRTMRLALPMLSISELTEAVNYSVQKRFKNTNVVMDNNYKNIQNETTLLELAEYINQRQPIVTSYGCMFARHANSINPLAKLLQTFMENRDIHKKQMFKYPKGSEQFEAFNLMQLLDKRDANSIYGVLGNATSVYYNLYVAASITTQGRSIISATGLQFEMFLNNNVDFASLDEIVTFIDNVLREERTFNDDKVLDRNITVSEVFYKICVTCGFGYIPSEDDLNKVWIMLNNCSQQDLNRLYYKNNLFAFMDTKFMSKALVYMATTLEEPFVNPNKLPKEIEVEMGEFLALLKEYVYYSYPIVDKMGKYSSMMRSVSLLTDTDSVIVSLDGWYRYAVNKLKDIDMPIKHIKTDLISFTEPDEFGDYVNVPQRNFEYEETTMPSYDFFNDDIIEIEKSLAQPLDIIPQDGVRYSIINIMAYCLTNILNDYIEKYTHRTHSYDPSRKCLLYLKNEFLFKSMLLSEGKKNYASIQEMQEGNAVPKDKQLDIKGLPLAKSTVNASTQKRLKKIIYEHILNAPKIDQVRIIKELAIFEKEIFRSLSNGEKTYYTPRKIKSMNSYDQPLRIFGIKQALAWNELRDDGTEAIDLEARNSVDIVKTDINLKNIEKIKEANPNEYAKTVALLNHPAFNGSIDGIAVPKNAVLPAWLREFIDYPVLINDNISNFPVELIGIQRGNNANNYTNIISL